MSTTRRPALPYSSSGFFVLRTPHLPLAAFRAFSEGVRAPRVPAGDAVGLRRAVAEDRRLLIDRLRTWVGSPAVREALFIASPDFDEQLARWLTTPAHEAEAQVIPTLLKYLARMTGRATPFGLFAGCSLGRSGDVTKLRMEGHSSFRRHSRLDGYCLSAIAEALSGDEAIRKCLVYRPNSSLYRAANQFRYIASTIDDQQRSFRLVSVEPTPWLEAALQRAAEGAFLEDVEATVAQSAEVEQEEAAEFVSELLDAQLLVSDLEPQVTGEHGIRELVSQLKGIPVAEPMVAALTAADSALEALDASGPGAPVEKYRSIAATLAPLPVEVPLRRLFQVDLTRPAPEATLSQAVVDELLRGVQLLHRIQPPLRASELDRFREAFLKRYGDREVPLMEALDEESGIGFARSTSPSAEAAPLLEGIVFPRPPGPEPRPDPRESILVQRFAEASWRRDREIRLSEKDIADLEQAKGGQAPPLPDAFSVGVTLAAASDEALAQGDYRMRLEHVVGPSGAVFLGRFCHTDPELRAYVESHLRAEEALRPAAVFAEIVHLPEGRLGNVLFRPVLRGYEIPFLGRSGAPSDRQLPVTDLRLSVRSGRLLLRSLKLQREVVPRLTSALNTNLPTSQGAHRFLAALQTDGVSGLGGWPWGPLATAPFLPRVTVGRFVLSLATWRLDEGQLQALRSEDPAQLFASVLKLREELELPRHLSLVDGDNVLPLDLDNVLSVEVFARIIRRRRSVTLSEQFPPEGELLAQGPEGRFVHELIVPFVRRPEVASALCPVRPPAAAGTAEMAGRRCFPPGSEWLYAKLYTGTGTADQVLASVVTDVVDRALQSGAARGWFFIRYADPGWHLRLRIAGEPRRLWAEVLPALRDAVGPMLQDGRVSEFLIGTYEREVERYGGFQAIEVAEEVFRVDSEAVLAIVGALAGDEGLDARWRLTLLGVDRLLQDFGFDLEARADLTGQMRRSAAEKLGMGDPFWHQTGARFRNERRSLESLLEGRECPELLVESVTALTARSERLSPLVENLRSVDAAGHLVVSLPIIAMSYVHMHTNRMLQSAGPAQEAVIYDLLYRLYQGQLARRRG